MFGFDDDKVFITAEYGGNHEDDFSCARRRLEMAAKSGVDPA